MEIEFNNYEYNDNKISFKINSKQITGMTGSNSQELIELLKLKYKYTGTIIINNKEVTKDNINSFKYKISSTEDYNINIYFNNIYEMMENIMKNNNMYPKNPDKRIKDAIKIVGLNRNILLKNIKECSQSEIKILKISFSLLLNPDMIIINEPFKGIDLINQKKLMILFRRITEKYNKTIVFISNNIEVLYKYTENIIVFKDNEILINSKTKKIPQYIELLIKNNIKLPNIIEFTYKSKRIKKVKIDYHQDIRDLIKDIYKHV